jgi:exosortase D (VPLPA-CTERM-specific)
MSYVAGSIFRGRRRSPGTDLALLLFALAAIAVTFDDALTIVVRAWARPESIHGPIALLGAAWLIWRRRHEIVERRRANSWAGPLVCIAGALAALLGQLASLFVVTQLGVLLCLYGLILSWVGPRVVARWWAPLALLLFVVPLPQFLRVNLLVQLQLVSAEIGVTLLRWAGVIVYAEGNSLDFGDATVRLGELGQGLQLLQLALVLSCIAACVSGVALWRRVLAVVACVPVMVIVNAALFALVAFAMLRSHPASLKTWLENWQPWVVLIATLLFVLACASPMRRRAPWAVVSSGRSAGGAASLVWHENPSRTGRQSSSSLLASALILLATALLAPWLANRAPVVPARVVFAEFPLEQQAWIGRRDRVDPAYLDVLRLDDYLLADFRAGGALPVNLYVAWYDTQQAGRSAHSPRVCLPGDGWQIEQFGRVDVPGLGAGGAGRSVNRAVIAQGSNRQIVYYWFQQRGRWLTNEYLVKWYLLWDSLTRNRTDGALVRLMTPLPAGADERAADARLLEFARAVAPGLQPHLPE